MRRDVLIEEGLVVTRGCLLEDGRPVELAVARAEPAPVGAVVLGRVTAVNRALPAAFVDIGAGLAGFLPLRAGDAVPDEGALLAVQVAHEPFAGKGARLSTDIALNGRYAVWRPQGRGVRLSSRLRDEAARRRLQALGDRLLADGGGLLWRTAAGAADDADLMADLAAVAGRWREALARRPAPPAVLAGGEGPAARLLAGWADQEPAAVVIDGGEAMAEARRWAARHAAGLAGLLAPHAGARPLFAGDVEDAFERAAEPVLALPSGGSVAIERTRALTAIDVDSGEAAARLGALEINLEAAAAIAARLRLADLGGLFVLDFVNMERAGDAHRLLAALDRASAADPAPISRSGLSPFGVIELTRRRRRSGLAEWLEADCAACAGTGRRASTLALAERLFRRARGEAAARPGRPLTLTAAPEVLRLVEQMAPERLAGRIGARLAFAAGPAGSHATDVSPR